MYTLIAAMTLSVGLDCGNAGTTARAQGLNELKANAVCVEMRDERAAHWARIIRDAGMGCTEAGTLAAEHGHDPMPAIDRCRLEAALETAEQCPTETAWAEQGPRGWFAVCGDAQGNPVRLRRVELAQGGSPGATSVLYWESGK